jgi:predicted dehydrogenase
MTASRLALVGAGRIATAYADVVDANRELDVVAVADIDPSAAATLAARLGCEAVQRVDDVFDLEPDAVVLCTPPNTHPALAQLCFDHGTAVFSEKPLAVDGDVATGMAAAAARAGVLLGMATKFRFCADVDKARTLLHDGRIGGVQLIEVAFTSAVDMSDRWNSDPGVSGGGVIIDNGTHAVDLVRFIAGPIAEVLAVQHGYPAGLAVEDAATLHLRTADGTDATVDLSWSIDKSLPDFLRVYGSEGEVRVGWRASAWRRYGEEWQSLGPGYAKDQAMGGALMAFCRARQGATPVVVHVAEAVDAARVIDACYASIRVAGWVKVAELVP